MKKKLFIIGVGGHSKTCLEVLNSTKKFYNIGSDKIVKKNLKVGSIFK